MLMQLVALFPASCTLAQFHHLQHEKNEVFLAGKAITWLLHHTFCVCKKICEKCSAILIVSLDYRRQNQSLVEERDLCKFTCVGGSIEKHHQQNIGIPQAIVARQQST